jgi:ATP-dependent Clp protease ATP-binding subunit ClpA
MARLIEDRIKRPLAEALLFGELAVGGSARVDRKDDGLVVDVLRSGPAGLLQ